jgi:Grx4 family monothiol glutaredoxin
MSASVAHAVCCPVVRCATHRDRRDATASRRHAWVASVGRGRKLNIARAEKETGAEKGSGETVPPLGSANMIPLLGDGVRSPEIAATPGVYAVYDSEQQIQYVGLSRKVSASVKLHVFELPKQCGFVRCASLPMANKTELQLAWKAWMMEHLASTTTGDKKVPPGNTSGNALWTERKNRDAKPNLRLTKGDGNETGDDRIINLCRDAVDGNKVVAFIKGTRAEPECGFSHRLCAMLDELLVDYETIDTLDETNNGNLRNLVKQFSDWPTIPQLYFNGELVGGHDILEEMHANGELKTLLLVERKQA